MIRVELAHRFACPLHDGFDYIVDPLNWPEYWPGLVRVEPGARWREPGDRARLVMRLLGRDVELDMTLRAFDPYRLVAYTSVQHGLPAAHHERAFVGARDGFDYRLAVDLEPRPGWRRAVDRVVVRRAVAGSLARTVDNLEARLPTLDSATPRRSSSVG